MTRWAIIGSSGFAEQTCIPTLLHASSAQLLGCCGSLPDNGARMAQQHGLTRAYATVEEVGADSEVEAVWIASPTGYHADQAIALIAARKSVLIEKPLALNLPEAERVMRSAHQAAGKVAVGFHQRFKTAHLRARQEVEAGAIGKLAYIRCHYLTSYDAEPAKWRRAIATSGGGWSINDIGTHLLDTVRFITRSDIVSAKAVSGSVRFNYETDDIVAGVLKLRNGAIGSIEASTAIQGPETRLELIGQSGSIIITNSFTNSSSITINGVDQGVVDEAGAYLGQISAFEALLNGRPSMIATLDDGVANLTCVAEMIKS